MHKVIRRRQLPQVDPLAPGNLHPLLARVYNGRGVRDPGELELGLEQLLPPTKLHNVERAAARLADALARDSRILVVGDFDADGATSTALAVLVLRAFGARCVDYLVPNRFEYGYGLTPEIVELAAKAAPDLLITVDNGISSLEGVAAARDRGIATLITDHHLPGRELPDADVIVNPNQPGCEFPSKNLAGVGVMFYVLLALRAELRRRDWFGRGGEPNLADHLDLVALGTVADVVPLDRNNRILVAGGLQRLRAGRGRPGIHALLDLARRRAPSLVAADLGFAVGPRINAAGRLDDMSIGIECLLSEDASDARLHASRLHELNEDRRVIERQMQDEAMQIIAALEPDLQASGDMPLAYTLYQGGWHQGVIGILAARVKDRLHRPTIAFADGDAGELKGSGRSIHGIHMRDVLDAVATRHPGLLTRFGGHAMAAGLTLRRDDLEAFSTAFREEVARHARDLELQAIVESDGELAPADFHLDVAATLRFAGPWGQHFPEPVFDGRFAVLDQRLVGERHLKLVLMPVAGSEAVEAIAFNIEPERWPDPGIREMEIAYRLDVNEFRGRRSLQLVVEHVAGTY